MKTASPASIAAIVSTLFFGTIFGFFFAWACSTLWGLDTIDPRVAIEAMQGMNASVQNAAFFPVFFLTPVIGALIAVLAWRERRRVTGLLFALAAAIYLCGGLIFTGTINVPMNEALALVEIPSDKAAAAEIWNEYSASWQFANMLRTIFSGIAFALAVTGMLMMPHIKARMPFQPATR